jgi:hypothetical protein
MEQKGRVVRENTLAFMHIKKYYCAGAVLRVKNYQYEEPNKDLWGDAQLQRRRNG